MGWRAPDKTTFTVNVANHLTKYFPRSTGSHYFKQIAEVFKYIFVGASVKGLNTRAGVITLCYFNR